MASATRAMPLARHLAIEAREVDEARERVAKIFCPHKLEHLRPRQALDMHQRVARLGALALSYITYGAEVLIDPGELSSFFLVHLIPSGYSEIHIGNRAVAGSTTTGSVSSPTLALRMRWSADCAHLVLKIERRALERHLASLLGDVIVRPIEFDPMLPLGSGLGCSFRRLINFVVGELDREDALVDAPLGLVSIEQTLMTALLVAQPHSYSAALTKPASPATPRHVKRAEDLIRAHPERALTIADLTQASGVSARALFEGFRRFRGTTPMALLKAVRIERAHTALSAAMPHENVSAIAFACGIVHLGRFAQEYRRCYGELPSETLRRHGGG
jgi:AraC-like DNA-binding protein